MKPSTSPTAEIFIQHLGQALGAVDVKVFAEANKPDFSLPDHSPIGGVFFKRLGFSITFCPPSFYHCDKTLVNAPPIITNVQIYSGDDAYGHARYEHELPHGLDFGDSRAALHQKLGTSAWTFPFVAPIKIERWDFSDHWLLAVYADDMSAIRMIQIGLQAQVPTAQPIIKIDQPDIHTLQSLLEHPLHDVMHHSHFQGMDFSALTSATADVDDPHEVDELKTCGTELYFRPSQKHGETGLVLSGARYIRKGVYFSRGFDGDMPKGIRFEDTPEVLVQKVGSFPVTGHAHELTGYYVWNLPEYMLHVGFSVMEQRVNRIRIAAHNYFSNELLKSPRLTPPA